MYDDGQGAGHDFCIICYKKYCEMVPSAAFLAMGNKDTQHINSFGYCATHLDSMVEAFHRRELCVSFFGKHSESRERADEMLIRWKVQHYAYFV